MESKLNNFNFYDQVVGTVVANVISETARTDNQIYLKWFDPSSSSHMVYFNGALIAAAIFKNKINLDMPLYKYLWFKLTNWKNRKFLQHININKVPEKATQVQVIIDHIEQHYEFQSESYTIWKSIYDTYYNKKKGVNNDIL